MKLGKCLLLAIAALAIAPAAALADSVGVAFSTSDLAEGVPALVSVSYASSGNTTSHYAYAYAIPAGGSGCAPTRPQAEQQGADRLVGSNSTDATKTFTDAFTPDAAGDFVACGYVETSSSNIPTATTAVPFHVRVANATLSISQASVAPDDDVSLTATYRAEATRRLFVDYRLAGVACAATFLLDRQSGTTVYTGGSQNLNGAGTQALTFSAPSRPGSYIVCGYLQSDSDDTTPDATATSTFTVVGPTTGTTPTTPTTSTTGTTMPTTTTTPVAPNPVGPTPCDVATGDLAAERPRAARIDATRTSALSGKRAAQARSEAALRSYRRARSHHAARSKVKRLYNRYVARRTTYRAALATFSTANKARKTELVTLATAQSAVDAAC